LSQRVAPYRVVTHASVKRVNVHTTQHVVVLHARHQRLESHQRRDLHNANTNRDLADELERRKQRVARLRRRVRRHRDGQQAAQGLLQAKFGLRHFYVSVQHRTTTNTAAQAKVARPLLSGP